MSVGVLRGLLLYHSAAYFMTLKKERKERKERKRPNTASAPSAAAARRAGRTRRRPVKGIGCAVTAGREIQQGSSVINHGGLKLALLSRMIVNL